MEKNKDVIFGIIAVKLGLITHTQLSEAESEWVKNEKKSLPEILVEKKYLREDVKEIISKLVNIRFDENEENYDKVLNSLGGSGILFTTYSSIISSEGSQEVLPSIGGGSENGGLDSLEKENVTEEHAGRYTIKGEKGRGGLGRILLAFDSHLGRDIAMKELLISGSGDQTGKDTPISETAKLVVRFLTEARITGRLEHPSIVPVYEIGKHQDGSIYYTMKLVKGRTLTDKLKGEKDYEGRIKYLMNFIDLCNAIGYAHSRGVIHRDIKPQNIMIGEFGETVVLDWGLAKIKGKTGEKDSRFSKEVEMFKDIINNKTLDGGILGTPVYMPPEQAEGLINEIDEKSDIYSLGTVLFEILTGHPPFSGETVYEVLGNVINGDFPEIKDKFIPPELISICRKAMNKEKKERYDSALDLADDISKFISGSLVSAYSYNPWERLKKFIKKNKSVVITGMLGFIGVVAISVIYGFYITKQKEQSQVLLSESLYVRGQNLEIEKDLNNACESFSRSWILNRDPSKEDLIKFDLLRNIKSTIPLKGKFPYQYDRTIRFFPAENTAVQLIANKLVLFDFTERKIKKELPADDVENFFFDNTGKNLIITDRNGTAYLQNIETGEREKLFEDSRSFNIMSNDGSMLCSYDEWGFKVYDLKNRTTIGSKDYLRDDVTGIFRLKFSLFSRDGKYLVNASVSSLGLIRIYALPGLDELMEIQLSAKISKIDITESNKLVCSDGNGYITIIPLDGIFKDVNKVISNRTGIRSFAVDNNENVLAGLNSDNTMNIIDFKRFKEKIKVVLPGEFNFISFNSDNSVLYLGNGEEIFEYDSKFAGSNFRIDHEDMLYDIAVSPGSKYFIFNFKNKIDIYNHSDYTFVNSISMPETPGRTIAVNDEENIIAVTRGNRIEVGDIYNFNQDKKVIENDFNIYKTEINKKGKLILTWAMDGTLTLWDIETGKEHARYRDYSQRPMPGPCFTPDGRYFIYYPSNTEDEIKFIDVENLNQVLSLESRYYKFSSTGDIIFNMDSGKKFTLYDMNSLEPIQQLDNLNEDNYPVPVDVTPDGKYLILSAIEEVEQEDTAEYILKDKDFIIIYDLKGNKEVGRISHDYENFNDFAFYDNKLILRFSKNSRFENSVFTDNVLIFFNMNKMKIEGSLNIPQISYFKFSFYAEEPVIFVLKNNVFSLIPINLLFLDKYKLKEKINNK